MEYQKIVTLPVLRDKGIDRSDHDWNRIDSYLFVTLVKSEKKKRGGIEWGCKVRGYQEYGGDRRQANDGGEGEGGGRRMRGDG
jgi:hypothetical protein